jgi:two-component system chemotaxis sensor kinase CheA
VATEGIDPSLLQDFLTESGELIEQLDADLVSLEEAADTAQAQELLNSIFRALHTIKGAASFLGLKTVTTFSHAAEDALNRLRKGDVAVTTEVMDAMLKSADVIRGMIGQIAAGTTVEPGPQELAQQLHAIAQGKATATPPPQKTAQPAQQQNAAPAPTPSQNGATSQPLKLPSQKVALVEFMVTDLRDQAARIAQAIAQLREPGKRNEATSILTEVGEEMVKTSDFFELDDLKKLGALFGKTAATIETIPDTAFPELLVRLDGILFPPG